MRRGPRRPREPGTHDVPFDAQTAASVAAQLGAPMFITNPDALSDAAAAGIADLNPEVIVVAGGEFAISESVADEAAGQCSPDPCEIDRRFGTGRDETAAALAGIAADYGFDRPVLQGANQVAGDVHVGGTVHTDSITVQDTGVVSGLNADRLDGVHASDYRFIDVPLLGIHVSHGASKEVGGTLSGIALPDTGTPTFNLGFTVPPDYTPGDVLTTRAGARRSRPKPGGLHQAVHAAVARHDPLEPMDSIAFGFYRSSESEEDTCTSDLMIHGVTLTY